MNRIQDKLIVALDVPTFKEAQRFVKLLKKEVSFYKVGSILFTAEGPDAVRMIHDEGGRIFLDLKFHDIPHTVARACEAAARLGVFMLNVHASGGEEMLKSAAAAVKNLASPPILLGVTVLTSEMGQDTADEVVLRAGLCQRAGLNGVVCSVHEIEAVRRRCGKGFVIVTPGIRPEGSAQGDQKRTAAPQEAFQKGADYIVVGRPILEASDPLRVVKTLLFSNPNSL